MTDEDEIATCVRDSRLMRTLVGIMQRRGIDVVVSVGETAHGIPFCVTVTQGAYTQHADVDGRAWRSAVVSDRERQRLESEQN